jgi:hypothetical protein
MYCRTCSNKDKKLPDVGNGLRECKKCKMVYPCDKEHFYLKDSDTGRLDRTCKKCDDARKSQWNSINIDKKRFYSSKEFKRNYARRKENKAWVLKRIVSSAICNTLKKRGISKDNRTWKALSYTPQQLKEHLELQFDEKMNWDNYGSYWHIDHIYPQSLLPYESLEDDNFKKCWELNNLRPLEAIENIKKSNKLTS